MPGQNRPRKDTTGKWGQQKQKDVLDVVGAKMVPHKMRQAFQRDGEVEILGQWVTGKRPVSVLIVGESGVGKTAVFEEMVRGECCV